MPPLNDEERRILLTAARSSIERELTGKPVQAHPDPLPSRLLEDRGCFVTLHKKGSLRGCIGTIEPTRPLIEGVEENACNSAFRDYRFPSLKKKELPDVDIEVSVLTVPEELRFTDGEDLKRQLGPGIHGVILSRNRQRATFLPQVWDQLPDPDDFLEHLCLKAGMDGNCWRRSGITVEVYSAEYFSE